MKRRIVIRCSMYLAIGAAISMVIALRLANLGAEVWASVPDERVVEKFKRDYRGVIAPERFSEFGYATGQSTGMLLVLGDLYDEQSDTQIFVAYVAAGWPMRCIEGTYLFEVSARGERQFAASTWLVPTDSGLGRWIRRRGVRRVPFHVRPLGLLVNSVFYGVIAAAIFGLVRRIRRRARLDRGLCPQCRYNLRGAPAANEWIRCSECGERLLRVLLSRPRQLLRLWMTPFLLPVGAFALVLFFSAMDWHWLRVNLLYIHPLVEPWNVYVMIGTAACIGLLAFSAYDDRPGPQRVVLAVIVALGLSASAFCSVLAMAAWIWR